MRILLTGATGFAGGYLAEALLARPDVELLGISRRGAPDHRDTFAVRACDLTRTEEMRSLLAEWQPEQIFHLAGYAHVGRSFREADAAWEGNLSATRCLLDTISRLGAKPRILLVSSGLVYGEGDSCDEGYPLRPGSPYAVSKAAADLLGYQCWRTTGLEIVRARPFNHIGPRQSDEFAVAHFARQIVEMERGRRPPMLETGDLRPRRDLSDVRDIVQGYMLVMEKGRAGDVYNLGSGEAHAMGDVLERLRSLSGVRCEAQQRAELLRDAETTVLRADASKARRELGWRPRYSLEQTLTDILAYWRQSS